MAETSGYKYRVLALHEPGMVGEADFPGIADLGWHRARTPDAAIEAACQEKGLPETATGACVAVAERYWVERQAAKRMVPVWEIRPIGEGDEGEGEKRDLPPAAGDDLADGLDPQHPCEWSEEGATCEHLPGDHGSHGLGMCRVKGCPCGGYQPLPLTSEAGDD